MIFVFNVLIKPQPNRTLMKSVVKPKIPVGLFGMASAGLVKLNCREPVSYRDSA